MQHNIPAEIKTTFFEFLDCRITVMDFEQWVYKTLSLEETLNSDDYLDLISIDYTRRNEKHYFNCRKLIDDILKKYISLAEYETWKLERLLNDFWQRKGNLARILEQFYDLYCEGYGFLDNLGLFYGCDFSSYLSEIDEQNFRYFFSKTSTASEIEREIEQKVNDILPEVDEEIKKVLSWLEQGKIEIIDDPNPSSSTNYIDNRSESEKIPLNKIRQINH